MFKKIILILLICGLATSGFAQKNKKKSTSKSPKSEYFIMLINGKETPEERYCPEATIEFKFDFVGEPIENFTFRWYEQFLDINDSVSESIKLAFPITAEYPNISTYNVYLYLTIPTDSIPLRDTLMTKINVDYIRTILDTTVCKGRNITVPTNTHDSLTYTDVQGSFYTPPDTLQSASGCDSLVSWYIHMNPYIEEKYEISSCDSVIWGHIIVRPYEGDKPVTVDSVFLVHEPFDYCCDCDTLKILEVTIIDTAQLIIDPVKVQEDFCNGDDMGGSIELETNFTAFEWTFKDEEDMDKDSIVFEKSFEIEYSGWYYVHAYMDTSLYETLKNLRIVNCFLEDKILVEDCDLIIPNVITPNGDGTNDVLGIKKLNPKRENELTIYDRWGKTVFHKEDYTCVFKNQKYENEEDAFAGISNWGQELPDGTYYYAFKYAAIPKTKKYTGTIVILR